MQVLIYSKQTNANGVSVIVNNFLAACLRYNICAKLIKSLNLEMIDEESIIIPYGVKEAVEVINFSFQTKYVILTDAVSLGYLNKIKFYLKKFYFLQYDFFYSVYAYLKYSYYEKRVCKKYDKVILVSPTDINYLVKITGLPKTKFIHVANGVNLQDLIKEKTYSKKIRLGLLASWGARQTFEESAWFVKKYFAKYAKNNLNVCLKLIGRGPYIETLRGYPNVEVIGEVDSLNEAFAGIDIFIGANPKGCGVLNRVLDAMSFKTPILALPECFTGMPNSNDLYFKFSDYNSFVSQIDYILTHQQEVLKKIEASYEYVKTHHNWYKNYDELVSKLFK